MILSQKGGIIFDEMIAYLLGLVTGLVVSTLVLVSVAYFRPAIDRSVSRTLSIMKKKGSILEPDNEEVEEWLGELPTE